ncbi:hypothetical protein HHK36_006654 [Tetracentron sinense]|uniref:Uncharacterized protein n=1 Tax=Tetracentron sinense TaxID=13715 RepID=A0A834ZKX6_TETSI|nr:hypothetical protein HHK36_006654 [Tetracentron sinense]
MVQKLRRAEAVRFLRSLKETFELQYCVRIQDDALIFAVQLAWKHFDSLFLLEGGTTQKAMAVTLVQKACKRLRRTAESNADENELLMIEYALRRSQVERNELKKEKDLDSKDWLARVDKELRDAHDKLDSFRRKWKPALMLRQRLERRAEDIYRLEKVRKGLVSSLEKAEWAMDITPLSEVVQEIGVVLRELEQNTHEYFKQSVTVGPDQIAEVASHLSGIPSLWLRRNPEDWLTGLRERLCKRVIGQDQAIDAVTNTLLRPRAGTSCSHRPIGLFLFVGHSGVGKAELAKSLAEQIFCDENLLIRIDMSDYTEPNSLSRLIGSPPGSDSNDECGRGQLTEAVRRRPYSVVLFVKVEKAHFSIIEALLEILSSGRLEDGQRNMIDFTNTVVIMISNVGAEQLSASCRCHLKNGQNELTPELRRTPLNHLARHKCTIQGSGQGRVLAEVRRQIKPELLVLLDEIIVFNESNQEQKKAVARLHLREMASAFAKRGVTLYPSDAALTVIIMQADEQFGKSGKAIKRWLEENLTTVLLEMLAEDKVNDNPTIYIDNLAGTRELSFRLEKSTVLVEDRVFKQFEEPAEEMRIMYRKDKARFIKIYRLRKVHNALMCSLRNSDGVKFVYGARAVQELVKMIDIVVENTINVNFMPDESLVVCLSCLNEAELIRKKRYKEEMKGLRKRLHKRVGGQQEAIVLVTEAVLWSIDAPIDLPHQPAWSFLFLGLSSASKTEFLKGLAEHLFTDDGRTLLIPINLSEYTDPHSLPRLLGSPSGCTTHECGLQLLEAVRRRPYSVLLFDQVEKAHISVLSTLLWMLDHGSLIDGQKRMVDFRNTIVIMISDMGNKEFLVKLSGHSSPDSVRDRSIQQLLGNP